MNAERIVAIGSVWPHPCGRTDGFCAAYFKTEPTVRPDGVAAVKVIGSFCRCPDKTRDTRQDLS